VNAVASQDHDSIVFGAPVLIRNVTISGKRRLPGKGIVINVVPERIQLSSVLASTGLTRDQLVDFAILLGTDFNPDGFEGVGPATALKYLKKYGRLEEIKELREPLQSVDYAQIRSLYLNAPSNKGVQPEWKPLDRDRIVSFLVGEHSFSRDRVDAALARVNSSRPAQTETLEKWFG
jgi:flap endonuclease-1